MPLTGIKIVTDTQPEASQGFPGLAVDIKQVTKLGHFLKVVKVYPLNTEDSPRLARNVCNFMLIVHVPT
jgi:hypothetical protein